LGLRGIDISNHQSAMDVERVVRENDIEFVFILTNDGTFVNVHFHAQADAAERAGAIVLPYVYLRPNWAQTIDVHLSVVGDRYGASIVDVEEGSGGWAETYAAHQRLWAAGQRTPLVYFPNFYWQRVGSPDLSPLKSGVGGHWKSWYADSDPRSFDDALSRVPGYVWNDNRGGIPVSILQFTGTGRLSGYGSNVDLNFFPGTRTELAALLGGGNEDGDMPSLDDLKKMPIKLHPDEGDPDQRPEAPFEEVVSFGNKAAWRAADTAVANGIKLDALLGRDPVDEAELARQLLAQGLNSQLGRIPDDQFAALVRAIANENDRRDRLRANADLGKLEAEEHGQ